MDLSKAEVTSTILANLSKYKTALNQAQSLAKCRLLDSEHPIYQSIMFYKQRIQELRLQLEAN